MPAARAASSAFRRPPTLVSSKSSRRFLQTLTSAAEWQRASHSRAARARAGASRTSPSTVSPGTPLALAWREKATVEWPDAWKAETSARPR